MAKDLIQVTQGLKKELPQLMPGEIGFCTDTGEVFIGSGDGNTNVPLGAKGEKGDKGENGTNGVIYTPNVSSDGVLSWTNNGGLDNPEAVNVKGKMGEINANITKNPNDEVGDIIATHLIVGSMDDGGAWGSEVPLKMGSNAFMSGYYNISNGNRSFIGGGSSNATKGESSAILGGDENRAYGDSACTLGGFNLLALDCQVIMGHLNKNGTLGSYLGTSGDAFIIGNGTYTDDSNAFRVAYDGNVYCAGEYNSNGADYAEMFEWADGNPNNEDRRGLFAYIENDKIRLATAEDTDKHRLGIISARPAVVGDNFDDDWCGKYLTDIFGAVLTQVIHHEAVYKDIEVTNPKTGEEHIETVCIRKECDSVEPILNPEYNLEQKYIPRAQRPEYDYWSFIGKLVVTDDGTCEVGGYCYPSVNGIATTCADESRGFYVMERLDDTHIKLLLK